MEIRYKKMGAYAATDGKNIYINRSKNKGIQMLDSILHEKNHIDNMKAPERDIIDKTEKQRNSYLSII